MPSSLSWLKPPSRALVVGINQYDDRAISPLNGCVRDAREMVTFLHEIGMSPPHIRLLTSPAEGEGEQRATRAAMIAGIREFLGSTPAGEEALFYYSGHGSTTNLDASVQFGKTKGETFVPADARVGDVLDILNLELTYLLAELVAKGIRVTVIADSCHSGGVFRSDRVVAPDPTVPVARLTGQGRVKRTLESLLDGGLQQEEVARLVETALPTALIAGSLPDQQSFERAEPGGAIRGVMTSTLLEVLRSANGPLSYRELGRSLRSSIVPGRDAKRQYPSVSSSWNRYLFSDKEEDRTRPIFVVQEMTETGIRLDGGEIEGVEVESELTCFTDWTLEQPHGRWRVTRTTATHADAVALEGAPLPRPGQPLQLDQVPNRPTVYFHPSADRVAAGWRDRESKGSPFLVEVYSAPADYIVQAENGRWVTRRRSGEEVSFLNWPRDARGHTEVAFRLDQVACYERFTTQQSPSGNALSLSPQGFLGGVELKLEATQSGTPLTAAPGALPLASGARVAITVHNHSESKRYAYVYRLEPERYLVQRVWPTANNAELKWNDAPTAYWEGRDWKGGLLRFKLIVSSEPLEMGVWPCGDNKERRGGSPQTVRALDSREEGWGIAYVEVGLPPA